MFAVATLSTQTPKQKTTLANCPLNGTLSFSCLNFHETFTKIGHTFCMNYYEVIWSKAVLQ